MAKFGLALSVACLVLASGVSRANAVEEKRVVYRQVDDIELAIDLFLPAESDADRPAFLWFHGGGWQGGAPRQFFRQARRLAELGVVSGSVRYRLSGEAPFPACLQDCKAAVGYLRRHAKKFGVDPERIGVGGGSAGAHLAAMVGLTPGEFEPEDLKETSSRVACLVLFNPPTDLRPMGESRAIRRLAGEERPTDALLATMSPVLYVSSQAPPTLLLHGDADRTVPHIHSAFLHRQLRQAGVKAELFTAKGAGHGWFNRGEDYRTTLAEVERFLKETLLKPE